MNPSAPKRATPGLPHVCPVGVTTRHRVTSASGPVYPGEFNRSLQHLLILLDEEVAHGDFTDMVHDEAEGRQLTGLVAYTRA